MPAGPAVRATVLLAVTVKPCSLPYSTSCVLPGGEAVVEVGLVGVRLADGVAEDAVRVDLVGQVATSR